MAPRVGRPAEAPELYRTLPERIYAALDAAWGYYTYPQLRYRGEDYFRGRRIDARVLEAHTGCPEVGNTPAKADGLVSSLRSNGFSDDELLDAGLAQPRLRGAPLSGCYRQRALTPVRDDRSRIAGFIGRNIGDQQRFAKYKNPPRIVVYDKSVNAYQPLPAPADPHGQVVVEGTLDAMAIAVAAIRTGQAGRFCPVTQSGRELSRTQLTQIIGLHATTPVLAFDGDSVGRDSAYRDCLAAAIRGRAVAVTVQPDNHDLASWLAGRGDNGLNAWVQAAALGPAGEPPRPVHVAAYEASYLAALERMSSVNRTVAAVSASGYAGRIPRPPGFLWESQPPTAMTGPEL